MRKTLLLILGLLFALLLCIAAMGLWSVRRTEQRREARILEIEVFLPDLQGTTTLDAQQACLLLEHHLLSRPLGPALAVDCSGAVVEQTGAGAVKISGAVYASSLEHALLGGGHDTAHCLAQSRDGWTVVGEAWELDGCTMAGDKDEPPVEVANRWYGLVDGLRAVEAQSNIRTLREALAAAPEVPDRCEGLEPASGRAVTLVDTRVWSEAGLTGFWHTVSSPVVAACLEGRPASEHDLACGLGEPWRYVLVLDDVVEDPPRMVDADTFEGGHYRATLKLVDMAPAGVRCARPVSLDLEGTVILGQGDWITSHFTERLKETLCAEVAALTEGAVALDPYFGCD